MINSDDIERNGFPWAMSNEVPTLLPEHPLILNTDQDGDGLHWIMIMTHDTKGGRIGYIYDSLGPDNARVTSKGKRVDRDIVDALRENGAETIHIYPNESQVDTDTLCGWHALYAAGLIKEYLKKHPRAPATSFDKVIKSQYGSEASKKGIMTLQKAFK